MLVGKSLVVLCTLTRRCHGTLKGIHFNLCAYPHKDIIARMHIYSAPKGITGARDISVVLGVQLMYTFDISATLTRTPPPTPA